MNFIIFLHYFLHLHLSNFKVTQDLSICLLCLQEKADLGELNFSLCYLPTAGRLTVTIIKATNLKAMDLTGFSGAWAIHCPQLFL